ncbi:hypothetical protein BDV38DRAFT_242621 [Aspergillus pseudotamarii]|uniref:Secreted protein n=1 Tax=Aspergillus pseudotamarii TaxID=132259 RepID=A0A5N6T150_ASPPS|nr:uncharacterized protein BDV38DRAFT_242621 [Aspergillus pseudotamarii]KAE8139414.1 hypothetical protein BDV38DRAFT_242621 [Aspergillus pseudotamarii]
MIFHLTLLLIPFVHCFRATRYGMAGLGADPCKDSLLTYLTYMQGSIPYHCCVVRGLLQCSVWHSSPPLHRFPF